MKTKIELVLSDEDEEDRIEVLQDHNVFEIRARGTITNEIVKIHVPASLAIKLSAKLEKQIYLYKMRQCLDGIAARVRFADINETKIAIHIERGHLQEQVQAALFDFENKLPIEWHIGSGNALGD